MGPAPAAATILQMLSTMPGRVTGARLTEHLLGSSAVSCNVAVAEMMIDIEALQVVS